MHDFWDKRGVFEEKMGDFWVKWGIFEEKMHDFLVKWIIFKEKMGDFCLNEGFSKRKWVIFAEIGDFCGENG